MKIHTPLEAGNFESYLRERDEAGKLIIRDLIGPAHNLLNLNREMCTNLSQQNSDHQSSAEVAVDIAERLLHKVLSLYALAYNNQLLSVTVFDVREVIDKLLKADPARVDRVHVAGGEDRPHVVGDPEVLRILLDNLLGMLHDRFGKQNTVFITLVTSDETLDLHFHMKVIQHSPHAPEQSLDTVFIIDRLTRLMNASLSMNETEKTVDINLKMTHGKAT
jgi:hypothetical protein